MNILLQPQELLDLGTKVRGKAIYCQSGICWLTQEGDDRDYVLRAGHSYTPHQNGRLLLTAVSEVCISLISEQAETVNIWQQLRCND